MTRISAGMLLAAGISLSFGLPAFGAETPKLVTQASVRNMIQEALNQSPAFSEITRGKKVVPSTMLRYKARPPGAPTESDFVEALHFNYDNGKTIRTIYNLTDKNVVKIDALEAYPTPLASEEIAEARKLADEKDDRARAVLRKYRDQIAVSALAPVIADRSNKRFGKRLAILVFTPKRNPADGVTVTVNLTDKTVSRD
jgi:hypothetical protein